MRHAAYLIYLRIACPSPQLFYIFTRLHLQEMLLAHCTWLILVAIGMPLAASDTYVYRCENVTSAIILDNEPGKMLPVLRTKNLLYFPLSIDYTVYDLNITINRSTLVNYFPYIDPGFTLKYADNQNDKILLQHAQQQPQIFQRANRSLRSDPSQSESLSSNMSSDRGIDACYSVRSTELEANVTLFTNGELDLKVVGIVPLSPSHTAYSYVTFCNATRGKGNDIIAEGWSTNTFPYVYAPWTLQNSMEGKSTMILSLGNGREYVLTKEEVCNPVVACLYY